MVKPQIVLHHKVVMFYYNHNKRDDVAIRIGDNDIEDDVDNNIDGHDEEVDDNAYHCSTH